MHEKEGQSLRLMSRPMIINVGKVQYPLGIDQERYRPQLGPKLALISLEFHDLKFIYSEKATKFCKIFPLLLTTVHTVKSKGKISHNLWPS